MSSAFYREIAKRRILARIADPLARKVMENNLRGLCNPKDIPHLYFPRPKRNAVRKPPHLAYHITRELRTQSLCDAVDRVQQLKAQLRRMA